MAILLLPPLALIINEMFPWNCYNNYFLSSDCVGSFYVVRTRSMPCAHAHHIQDDVQPSILMPRCTIVGYKSTIFYHHLTINVSIGRLQSEIYCDCIIM